MNSLEMSDIKAAFPAEEIELLEMVGEFLLCQAEVEAMGSITIHRVFAQRVFDERQDGLHERLSELDKKLSSAISRRTHSEKSPSPFTQFALCHLVKGYFEINNGETLELETCVHQAIWIMREAMADQVERALSSQPPEGKMTPEEAAELLAVPIETLKNWRDSKRGPPYYKLPGGSVRYEASKLEGWLKTQRKDPGQG